MQSTAKTVDQYLKSLPEDRRTAISAVRQVILKNLDKDYEENMSYGMIGYCVPHRVYPAGYHCNPAQALPFAALASQKNYMSVYLMCTYGDSSQAEWFKAAWAKTGKKLDMGKSCIRFKKVENLALGVIGEAIRRVPVNRYIAITQAALKASGRAPVGKRANVAKKTTKPAANKSTARK